MKNSPLVQDVCFYVTLGSLNFFPSKLPIKNSPFVQDVWFYVTLGSPNFFPSKLPTKNSPLVQDVCFYVTLGSPNFFPSKLPTKNSPLVQDVCFYVTLGSLNFFPSKLPTKNSPFVQGNPLPWKIKSSAAVHCPFLSHWDVGGCARNDGHNYSQRRKWGIKCARKKRDNIVLRRQGDPSLKCLTINLGSGKRERSKCFQHTGTGEGGCLGSMTITCVY